MKDHSQILVTAHPSIDQELREYFAFYVPGYRYMPAYKRRQWDGRIKLYNQITKELPVGL